MQRILGSDEVLYSYNCHSPANNDTRYLHARRSRSQLLPPNERFRDMHYRSYFGYLRCITIIQVIGSTIGVLWATWIYILNTGTYADRKRSHWYSDRNSLCTTVGITFSFLAVLGFLQFVAHVRITMTRRAKLEAKRGGVRPARGFLGQVVAALWDSDDRLDGKTAAGRFSRVDHISFDIEEQERILRQHILGAHLIQEGRANLFGATAGAGDEEEGDEVDDVLEIGNIYKFNQNRNYYDSLESVEICRNEPPEYIEGGLSNSRHTLQEDSDEEIRRK